MDSPSLKEGITDASTSSMYSPTDGNAQNPIEINEDDQVVCEVCLDGEVYDDNEIIFCDKCNVAVHQLCYGVPSIPSGQWFCYPCSAGLDPKTVTCELCSNTGGAYKVTDKGKWAHPLCAAWIPEVFEVYQNPNGKPNPIINLVHLDKKRFRLKCDLCTSKGASIQCCYGRCTTAAHPWCILKKNQGYTRRIIKNEDGHLIWEVFCRAHAKSVTEPLKPKPKSKMSVPIEEDPVVDDYKPSHSSNNYSEDLPFGSARKNKTNRFPDVDSFGRPRLSMAHCRQFGDSNIRIYNDVDPRAAAAAPVMPIRRGRPKNVEDDDDGEDDAAGAGTAGSSNKSAFPILSLLEWPGQSEGEAMDLDHYWNVMSTYFPEDHAQEWLEYMLSGVQEATSGDALLKSTLGIPPLGTADPNSEEMKELAEITEEKLTALGGEREKNALFDLDKRYNLLSQVGARVNQLTTASRSGRSGASTDDASAASAVPDVVDLVTIPENAFYCREVPLLKTAIEIEDDAGFNEDGHATIRAVFDGQNRVACDFNVQFGAPPNGNGGGTRSKKAVHWHEVELNPQEEDVRSAHRRWVAQNLLPESCAASAEVKSELQQGEKVSVSLGQMKPIRDSDCVYLTEQCIIPRNEDNILCRALRTDQLALSTLTKALSVRLGELVASPDLVRSANAYNAQREEWKKVNDKYQKQQVWKQVCQSIHRGIRDQQNDFNKVEPESVPASWSIQVNGRPTQEEEEEQEVHEDAVCMCCFDGTSVEGNRILFCDGCNATLHQTCYGVPEIPEGDFFCDRCRYIQIRAADPSEDWNYNDGDVKNAVMCCLCPLYHGGLKPTTDGRWVHLCCAFWSGNASIRDMSEMGPIDISEVIMQAPDDEEGHVTSSGRGRKARASSKSLADLEDGGGGAGGAENSPLLTSACCYCKVLGGHVVQCCPPISTDVCEEVPLACSTVFHPICAWFDGGRMSTHITDHTFQGESRNGIYPSGIQYCFLCDNHAEPERPSQVKAEQKLLRLKYRINEDDLEQIPEKNKWKRKKPKSKKKDGAGGRQAGAQIVKDLNPDVYDDKICGICLEPTSEDIFSCGYDPKMLACDVQELTVAEPSNSLTEGSSSSSSAASGQSSSESTSDFIKSESSAMEVVPSTPERQSSSFSSASAAAPDSVIKFAHSPTVTPVAANYSQYGDKSVIMKCAGCGISIHKCCYIRTLPVGWDGSGPGWKCEVCVAKDFGAEDSSDVRCLLCPRRGGYFKRTNEDNKWVHTFCAVTANPGGRTLPDNLMDMHGISKEKGKQKCVICNRKGGHSVRCNSLGCAAHFHPICGMRSGKAFIRNRMGTKTIYCMDHIPEGVERIASGYWVDGYEIYRLRYCLDRARLITDILLRREKYKKLLCKSEMEWFNSRFSKALDKAAGRKHHKTDEGNLDLSEDESTVYEESDSEDEDLRMLENDPELRAAKYGSADFVADDWVPHIPRTYASADKEVRLEMSNGETAFIGASWTKKGEVKLPHRVLCTYAGIELSKKDTMKDTEKGFLRAQREVIVKNVNASRAICHVWSSLREENNFPKLISSLFLRHMDMQNDLFKAEMEELGYTKVNFQSKKKQQVGRPPAGGNNKTDGPKAKKGYAWVEEPVDVDELVIDTKKTPKKGVPSSPVASPVTTGKRGRPSKQFLEEQRLAQLAADEAAAAEKSAKKKGSTAAVPMVVESPAAVSGRGRKSRAPVTDEELEEEFYRATEGVSSASASAVKKGKKRGAATADEAEEDFVPSSPHHSKKQKVTESSSAAKGGKSTSAGAAVLGNSNKPLVAQISKEDREVYNEARLPLLERRLFDILNEIDFYKDPSDEERQQEMEAEQEEVIQSPTGDARLTRNQLVQQATSGTPSKSHKKKAAPGSAAKKAASPKGKNPNEFNLKDNTIDIMHSSLNTHVYKSMADFVEDFYNMLNDTRKVVAFGSVIWDETKTLAGVFEKCREKSKTTFFSSKPKVEGKEIRIKVIWSGHGGSNAKNVQVCGTCNTNYNVTNWPSEFKSGRAYTTLPPESADGEQSTSVTQGEDDEDAGVVPFAAYETNGWAEAQLAASSSTEFQFPSTYQIRVKDSKEKRKVKEMKLREQWESAVANRGCWSWVCPTCVSRAKENMVGLEIQVWWHDDGQAYRGEIDAYDPVSGNHRVLYEDGEWEFLHLANEPFVVYPKLDASMLQDEEPATPSTRSAKKK